MTAPASPMAAAHGELIARARAAGRTGDEVVLWESLESAADYLRRIVDHGDSRHYRAEKSYELVASALRVQREAITEAAADIGRDVDEQYLDRIYRMYRLVEDVHLQLTGVMWCAARGGEIPDWRVPDLQKMLRGLRRAVEQLCADAYPDPDGLG